MKAPSLIIFLIVFTSCVSEHHESTSSSSTTITTVKDSTNNDPYQVEVRQKGINCSAAYLGRNGEQMVDDVYFGQRLFINFIQLDGFTVANNEIAIKNMHLFLNENGDTIHYMSYKESQVQHLKVNPDEILDLNVSWLWNEPLFSNNHYTWICGIRDEATGRVVEGQVELDVLPNPNLRIENNGFSVDEIYIFDKTIGQYFLWNQFEVGHTYEFHFSNIDGFNLKGQNCILGAEIKITSNIGETVFGVEDLMEGSIKGMPFEEISESLVIHFRIEQNEFLTEENKLLIRVWDKNGDAEIKVETHMVIQNFEPLPEVEQEDFGQ